MEYKFTAMEKLMCLRCGYRIDIFISHSRLKINAKFFDTLMADLELFPVVN